MAGQPRHAEDSVPMHKQGSATRRAMLWLGGRLGMAAGLSASFGALSAEARKKKKKKKKKPPQSDLLLQAAQMTGEKEVDPNPGDPLGSGSAKFAIKANGTICCEFTFDTDTADSEVQLTHIHQGDATINGPIVVDFGGALITCVGITAALANQIKANPAGFYANLHTNKFMGGAVRDQLSLDPG